MEIKRFWAMPNKETFLIRPFAEILKEYVSISESWADPFAGNNSPASSTNDLNPKTKAQYHMEADDFMLTYANEIFDGVLFDPPYSPRQITECYQGVGKKATMMDTSTNFHAKIKDTIAKKIKVGGRCISFGWNSNGLGEKRGFWKEKIILVAHGGMHNDTICVIEIKKQSLLSTLKSGVSETAVSRSQEPRTCGRPQPRTAEAESPRHEIED